HGLGHARGPHRDGRESPDQHQDLRRRPQAAGPRPGDDVLARHDNAARGIVMTRWRAAAPSEAREPARFHLRTVLHRSPSTISRARLSISTSRVARPTWAPIRMVSDVQYIQTMMAAKPAVAPNAEVSCVI